MKIRAVAIALSFAAISAFAQFTPCSPPPTLGLRHIFVDDFRFPDEAGAPAKMKRVRDALLSNVKDQIEKLSLQNAPNLKAVHCTGRFPQLGDFTLPRLQSMNNRNVVMELWTEIRPSDPQHYDAEFNFVVVPAFLRNLGGANTSALFTVRYPLTSDPGQVLALLRSHPELAAYALIGAGLRAVENKDYDDASAYLCRGLGELQRVMPKTVDDRKLLAYVDAAKARVVADAKADAGYTGVLKLAGADTRCTR
ncbi:MAG TPA: hypothetical protein VEO74_12870 [Thermoanaerobaculia bacterium]|nr:hypothetical protein [Thermoanaerobaculia bacterium]